LPSTLQNTFSLAVKKLKKSFVNWLNNNNSLAGVRNNNKNNLIFSQTLVVCNILKTLKSLKTKQYEN